MKTSTKILLALGLVVLTVGISEGATIYSRFNNIQSLGKLLLGTNETNAVSRVLVGSVLVDFDGGTLGCTDIATGLAGVLQGDRCIMGTTTAYTANNTFECFASDAGEVTVRNCHLGVASDPASATYGFTIVSHQ